MSPRSSTVAIALMLLLVVDGAAVAWALWPRTAPPTSAPATTAAPAASPSPSPSKTASPKPSPTAKKSAVAPLTSSLVAASSSEAWVITQGSCGKPGTVSTTADKGDSWTSNPAPGALTRVKPSSITQGFVIGGDEECALKLWSTADGGASWGPASSAALGWARVPDDEKAVHTPRDEMVDACGEAVVLDLSAEGGSRASVLCGDGRVLVTTDNGSNWADGAERSGALSLSSRSDGSGFLAVEDADCDGTLVQPYAQTELGEGVCVKGATPVKGRTSVSGGGRSLWLLVGDDVWYTSALGEDWTRVSGQPG